MSIEGSKRVNVINQRKVGLFEAKVILINPSVEEYKEVLNIELKEDSKATEYLGESKDEGNKTLRVDIWLEEVKHGEKFKVTFFLEDKEKENKDMTKKQYINAVGNCSWADDPNNLPQWFRERDFRIANKGEEELYNFMRTWLSELDYRAAETILQIEWKRLMKGDVKDIRDQIGGEWCTNIGALATVISKEHDGDMKEYQGVYSRGFLPAYSLRNFRLINYNDPKVLDALKTKKTKDLKYHEKFVLEVTGEWGCKDFFILRDMKEYDPNENIVASDKPIDEHNSEY